MNIDPDNKTVRYIFIAVLAVIIALVTFLLLSLTNHNAAAKTKPVHHHPAKTMPVVKPKPTMKPTVAPSTPAPMQTTPAPAPVQTPTPAPPPVSSTTTTTGISIPGMPQSLANCIWERESTDGTNPAAGGNQFGIIPASGYNVAGDSVQQQEQVAGQIYATSGGAAWAADGCPGT